MQRTYAGAFHNWLALKHPEIDFNFSFGYSMDHPDLIRAIDFMNSIGSVSGRFLQMNGSAFRNSEEKDALMRDLFRHGVQTVNFTFSEQKLTMIDLPEERVTFNTIYLDDEYYRKVPEFSVFLKQYGNPFGQELYGKRDLYQHYQKKYLHENCIDIYNVTDERHCGRY